MLNLREVVNNSQIVKKKLQSRGFEICKIDEIIQLAKQRSSLMQTLQKLEAEKNQLSREIGTLKSKNKSIEKQMVLVANLKTQIDKIKVDTNDVKRKIKINLLQVPNLPLDLVPHGNDETANIILQEHIIGFGQVTNVKPHYEYGVNRGWLDFKRAVQMAGSRFWIYQNEGAKLVRALQNFMLDEHIKNGYSEILPPLIVNKDTMQGTGQLPKFESDLFKISGQDNYLIPTAEVPLTNLYANQIIDLIKPKMLTSFTPCFRAEAGAGGKDMKGLIRAHQFYKVEVVKITSKETLEKEFQKTLADCKSILEKLELSYREVMLCTGDLGFASERTIDLEIWIPSENNYREVSSVSSFGDFQSRRSMIRYRDNNQNKYAYTINGSGLSIDRVVAAILEIYQQSDHSLLIPKALIPYFKEDRI